MVLQKSANTNNDNESTDAIMQMALSCMRDFRIQAGDYLSNKSDEAALNRSASLLSNTIQAQHLNLSHLEITNFFIDLHAVVNSLSSDSDALWACINVLQNCSRNLEARKAMVEEYRFVPLLNLVLRRTQTKDKIDRVLYLLQDLTYGIRITWEEPYIITLIEQMLQIIYNTSDEETEDSHARFALSILINLCYKNFVVLFLFLRTVNISNFGKRIQNFGMLASKMMIIMSEDLHIPDLKELHAFIRSTFVAIEECLKDYNVPYTQHIVDFLIDSKSHKRLHNAMLSYDRYSKDIEILLDLLDLRLGMDDSSHSEETFKNQHICIGLLFKLIRYILEMLGEQPQINGSDKQNLEPTFARIFETLCNNWLESEICGVDAVNLLESLVRLAQKDSISARISRDPSILIQLISISEKKGTSAYQTVAILQLLLTLLHRTKTEKLILTKITESYFDKMFAPLLTANDDILTCTVVTLPEIEKAIFCQLLLINFAGIAKKAYLDKCCTLLQSQKMHQALARALLSENKTVCAAVFQISQFEHFPQDQVAQYISKLNSLATSTTAQMPPIEQWRNLNAIMKSHKTYVSKEVEERLNALIEIISNAQSNNNLNNVTTSQMIELYNYKMDMYARAENSSQKRLEDAGNEIANLTRRIKFQNDELQKYQTMNFELHINQEGLQTQCKDFKQQKDHLKRSMTDLMKKLSEQSESLQMNEKRLTVKIAELTELNKENTELKHEVISKTEELDRMQITLKDNNSRIDMLKKTITAFEVDVKSKLRSMEEKDRDVSKLQKGLEEQREANRKSESVITALEAQLLEKNEKIRNYELELNETEELRKTIMSLMESKKPKRKV